MQLRRFFSLRAALALAALGGCAAPGPGGPAAPQVTSAFFTAPPAEMHEAIRFACSGPGEDIRRPRPGVVQCRMLLGPDATAAAILAYDGMLEDLPRLVISLARTKAARGEVITACAFLRVPQRGGRVQRVVHNDPGVDARMRRMLRLLGGQPLKAPPPGAAEACLAAG